MGESWGGGWGYSGVRSLWVHCCQCQVYPGSLVSTCRHLHLMIPPVSQEGVECSSKMWTQLFNRATVHPDSRGGPCALLLAPRLPALHFRAPLPLSYTAALCTQQNPAREGLEPATPGWPSGCGQCRREGGPGNGCCPCARGTSPVHAWTWSPGDTTTYPAKTQDVLALLVPGMASSVHVSEKRLLAQSGC